MARIVRSEPTSSPGAGEEAGDGEVLTATPASLLAEVDAQALMDELVDRLLGGTPTYTPVRLSERSGVPREVSRKLWRAMGLADVPDEETAFTDFDLDALQRVKGLLGRGDVQLHLIVQLARVLGLATARIADSVVDFTLERLVADSLAEMTLPSTGKASCDGAEGNPADLPLVSLLLGELDELVIYLMHRHLVDATARRLSTVGEGATSTHVAVGFADLVGFTALSQELNDGEIVDLVERFETLTSNEVVAAGGRIIKMIGDEVMFAAPKEAGAEIALRLAEKFADPDVPSVRVGLASGGVLCRAGDMFGPVVNLAARATAIAHPGTVVISPDIRDRLTGDDRYHIRRLRPRRLKGIGFVELSVLRRAKSSGEAGPGE